MSGCEENARITLKVDVVMDNGAVILIPLASEGEEVLQEILNAGPSKAEWHFQGTRYKTPGVKDRIVGVSYACGGEGYWRKDGNVTFKDYKDAIKIHFDLSEVKDEDALYAMRDFGYFTGGLMIQGDSSSKQMRLGSRASCKECEGQLLSHVELDWKICDSCSERCEHEYEEGVGQANGHLAYLPFCTKCGRGDPNWQPSENPAEDILKTVSEGGVDVLIVRHSDETATIITTDPQQ